VFFRVIFQSTSPRPWKGCRKDEWWVVSWVGGCRHLLSFSTNLAFVCGLRFVCWAAQKVLIDCCEYGARKSLGNFRVDLAPLFGFPSFPAFAGSPELLSLIRHWRNPFLPIYLAVLGKFVCLCNFLGEGLWRRLRLRSLEISFKIKWAGTAHYELPLSKTIITSVLLAIFDN